jgi:hypothetical protein
MYSLKGSESNNDQSEQDKSKSRAFAQAWVAVGIFKETAHGFLAYRFIATQTKLTKKLSLNSIFVNLVME